jgi:import receptor subunit TOM20
VKWFAQLCHEGPEFAIEAALAFFRALRVYPSPVELIMIFQNTVPEPIFKVCYFAVSSSAFVLMYFLDGVGDDATRRK